MFCEPVHEVDLAKLRFLRWLIEQGKLEHDAFGASSGEYAGLAPMEGSDLDLAAGADADTQPAYAIYPDLQ